MTAYVQSTYTCICCMPTQLTKPSFSLVFICGMPKWSLWFCMWLCRMVFMIVYVAWPDSLYDPVCVMAELVFMIWYVVWSDDLYDPVVCGMARMSLWYMWCAWGVLWSCMWHGWMVFVVLYVAWPGGHYDVCHIGVWTKKGLFLKFSIKNTLS